MAPDQNVDAAKFHAEEIRRAMQRDECAETKMLTPGTAHLAARSGAPEPVA
jgi:hypothetical protein